MLLASANTCLTMPTFLVENNTNMWQGKMKLAWMKATYYTLTLGLQQ